MSAPPTRSHRSRPLPLMLPAACREAVVAILGLLILSGCEDSKVSTFNSAARKLHQMMTTAGNDDAEVLAACAAVEEAYNALDQSRVPKEQATAMKDVTLSAQFWKNQLTLMKLNALSTALGNDKSRDTAADMEIGRLMLPGMQRSLESYVEKYD